MNKSVPTTPQSPESPTSDDPNLVFELQQIYAEYKENDAILPIFKAIGLHNPTKITDTLQGSVWRAFHSDQPNSTSVIVKMTDKSLHQRSKAIIDNQEFTVSEDILKERHILKYITQQKQCPRCIIKYHRLNQNFFLFMEDGGESLFEFVEKAHRCIKGGYLELHEWSKVLKVIFKQMLESVVYIHSKNVAHFDISLENFLINDVQIEVDECEGQTPKMRFVDGDIRVKLCDFGLAEKFESNPCLSNKFCGKRQYKSPEIAYQQRGFDAKKNDIWCLGVCWFAMTIGFIPCGIAHESDQVFSYFVEHSIAQLLQYWNISKCVDAKLIYLFDSIFQDEEHRMNIHQIKEYMLQFVFD